MKRILIVNPFGIGDVLFSTPIVESIKQEAADNYVGYLCNARIAPIIISNTRVDKIFTFEKDEYRQLWKRSRLRCMKTLFRFIDKIRRERFDMVFDLSLSRQYGLFLKLCGIKTRLGYNYHSRGIFLTHKLHLPIGYHDKHIVDYYIMLLFAAGIKPVEDTRLKLYITDEDQTKARDLLLRKGIIDTERFACIVPGAGASWGDTSFRKQWPKENFTRVAQAITEKFRMKIVLLGSEKEKPICTYVEERIKGSVNLCGETELMVSSAIIKQAAFLLTNDGGPLHMGVALDTPTVSIFGAVDDKVYGPYPPSDKHTVIKNNDLNCRPCYQNFRLPDCKDLDCLNGISPEVVTEEVSHLLR